MPADLPKFPATIFTQTAINFMLKLKTIIVFAFTFLSFSGVKAQTENDYKSRIAALNAAINSKLKDQKAGLYYETTDSSKNENKHSWLWPLCALLQAANEMDVIEPSKNYMQPVEGAVDQYYSETLSVPAYQDYVLNERLSSRFYDDNEWIAIVFLDAYNRTHQNKYLEKSKMIYRFIRSGTDTVAGGGVYWKEGDKKTKNTCSNGPAILVALQLYKITKQAEYLKTAITIYNWTNQHLQSPDGLYYDNIEIPTLKIGKALYTYNTGTMLQANALLYQITKSRKYLIEAQRIAKSGKQHFFVNGRLPNGEYWFNAVMLRGYQELYKIDHNKAWIDFYIEDGNQIWNQERDAANLVGTKSVKRLIDQGAMLEIYARLEQLAYE